MTHIRTYGSFSLSWREYKTEVVSKQYRFLWLPIFKNGIHWLCKRTVFETRCYRDRYEYGEFICRDYFWKVDEVKKPLPQRK